jgi:TrmH family RNA methyltransferase
VERISSRQNAVVKRFRELHAGPSGGQVLLDGPHLLQEALSAGVELDTIAFCEAMLEGELRALANQAARAGVPTLVVTPQVLDAMSPVRNPSGVVAIARLRPATVETALQVAPQLVVVVHALQDPGNVGATIRAAESFGATGIVTTPGTADPFGWKALRGSMGSALRLPIVTKVPVEHVRTTLKDAGIQIVAAVPRGGTPPPSADLRGPTAIVLGGEGAGLADELIRTADLRVSIPMHPRVESLNVAAAAAIVLYEAARQRGRNR